MVDPRVSRGRASQGIIADWFAARGAPDAKSRAASLPGVDVYDIPGVAIEAKATAKLNLTGSLAQASLNAPPGAIPCVVYRPRGYGPAKLPHWIVTLSLADFTWLLQQAGLIHRTVHDRKELFY